MVVVRYSRYALLAKDKDGKEDRKSVGRSRSTYTRVHYKNTRETAAAIQGLKVSKALTYLGDVTEHKQCIPFTRHNGGVGRTAQAKAFGKTQGRWPVKSAKVLIALLKNAQANAEANELTADNLIVKSVVVNQAPKTHRRTYRAHGRINAYKGSPSHIEIILTEDKEDVERADEPLELATAGRRRRAPKQITAA